MKKYGFLIVCLLISMAAMSQKAGINFDVKSHDFGKVNEEDGKITHVFDFTNNGSSPLVVNRVQASCGCTTPTWTKEPIEPGKKGSITVTYNPAGRPGSFTKTITVYSNAADEQVVLIIKGEVIPKQSTVNSGYPVNMGGLLLKSKVIQMNNISKGNSQVRLIDVLNSTNQVVKPTILNLPAYMSADVTPDILKPNENGKITITINSKNCNQWGPISDDIYVSLNGTQKISDEYKITVVGNIVEDFSKMTLDQKRKAPIVELAERNVDLGVVKAGSKHTAKFKVSNKGQNQLEIRRIINNNKELVVKNPKLSINSGKSSEIDVDLNSKTLVAGNYKKSITIQTNDPDNSFMILVLSWTIQK